MCIRFRTNAFSYENPAFGRKFWPEKPKGAIAKIVSHEKKSSSFSKLSKFPIKEMVKVADPNEEKITVFDIIEEVNKGSSELLQEGDIKMKPGRSVIQNAVSQWMKSQGTVKVAYVLANDYGNSQKSTITSALKEFEAMTCVQFVPRTTETDYISIESGQGCWSYVGKVGGRQIVSISKDGCVNYGTVQHEIMHSLGFQHEHTRSDRDDYIDVLWDNIAPGKEGSFEIDDGNTQDLPYDYNSIMHFGKYIYSLSNQPTLLPKPDSRVPIGQLTGMDNLDVLRINSYYKCNLCRTKIIDPSGNFSYNSSSSDQRAKSCLWLIQSSDQVELRFSDINIAQSPGCNLGYIKIYDGVSTSSPVLWEKSCGNGPIPPLVSSGAFMLMEVMNNQPKSQSYFRASYKSAKYGGVFLASPGMVKSPSFPSMYPSNTDSVFSIVAPSGYQVSVTFTFFWLTKSEDCTLDHLTIKDGPLKTSPILGKFCGLLFATPSIVSSGTVMVLHFHSGNPSGGRGFTLNYTFEPAKLKTG